MKTDLASPETLALYSPDRETIVSADASSFGLGAVSLQRQNSGSLHPVAYASRSLSTTEQRYAQIEKEALTVTWSLEHRYHLLVGMNFTMRTDHKPLIPLFSTKNIDELPLRVQRFKMRLMRYYFDIVLVPDKDLCTADTLSRAPLQSTETGDIMSQAESFVGAVLVTLPASDRRLEEIRAELQNDYVLKTVMHHRLNQWPDKRNISKTLKPYYNERSFLSVNDGLLLKGSRIVIPATFRNDILRHLHDGHQGMSKTRENAANSVWWPGLCTDIDKMVQTCKECAKSRRERVEPMQGTPFPPRAWSRVATDFFYLNGKQYLLAIEYYSRDIEVCSVTRANKSETIEFYKSVFAKHGIADVLVSDNGTQYSSEEFCRFSASWSFEHVTSSPHYPQSNGEAELTVQTLKGLIQKCNDFYLGLLMYRNTKLHHGFSPAQLSMGRRLKTRFPSLPKSLLPQVPDPFLVKKREKEYREQSKQNYDRRHRVVASESLSYGDTVWIPDQAKQGTILQRHETPRSFIIKTDDGAILRRNQQMMRKLHFPSQNQNPYPLQSKSQNQVPEPLQFLPPDSADYNQTSSPPRANPQSLAQSPTSKGVNEDSSQTASYSQGQPSAESTTPGRRIEAAESTTPGRRIAASPPRRSTRISRKLKRLIE